MFKKSIKILKKESFRMCFLMTVCYVCLMTKYIKQKILVGHLKETLFHTRANLLE